jgi:hypothetical protein
MPRLEYLNIDCLDFDGAEFLQLCRDYQLLYGKKWPLKYLSIEEFPQKGPAHPPPPPSTRRFRFSLEQMEDIAGYLPSLEYLYIGIPFPIQPSAKT